MWRVRAVASTICEILRVNVGDFELRIAAEALLDTSLKRIIVRVECSLDAVDGAIAEIGADSVQDGAIRRRENGSRSDEAFCDGGSRSRLIEIDDAG